MKNMEKQSIRGGKMLPFFLVVIIATVVFGAVSCGSSASVVDFMDAVEKSIASSVKGGRGPMIAKVEDTPIYKGVFDRKYDMFVDNLPVDAAKKVQVKSSSKMMLQFLDGLIDQTVLLKSLKEDAAFLNDPEFLVYLSLKTIQTVQEYYVMKKIEGKVDQNITDKQFNDAYEQLKKNPNVAQRLARIPAARLKDYIKQQIIRQRQMAEVKKLSDRLKQGYRIKTFENALLGTGKK